MTDLDLDELDRLHAEATENGSSGGVFFSAIHKAYPALRARLRELESAVSNYVSNMGYCGALETCPTDTGDKIVCEYECPYCDLVRVIDGETQL